MPRYDVFIEGELMDLCCPSEQAIHEDGWHAWFNDPKITRYLDQGVFPNTVKDQMEYLESLRKNKDRVVLLIRPKGLDKAVGVASLSGINFVTRGADFALVIGDRNFKTRYKELIGMEAKCRMIEHAFEVMGLERIGTSQAVDLRVWQKWQVLLGVRIEGVRRDYFRKGLKTCDAFCTSILLKDYLRLKELRNGFLWPGAARMMEMIRLLPKKSFEEEIEKILNEAWAKYYSSLTLA